MITIIDGHVIPFDPNWTKLYKSQLPFPHIVIDNFLPLHLCRELNTAYDNVNWQSYRHYNEDKECSNTINLPEIIRNVIRNVHCPHYQSHPNRCIHRAASSLPI